MINRCANYASNVVEGIGLLPVYAGYTILEVASAVSGLFFTVLSAVTAGKVSKFNRNVNKALSETSQILPSAFGGILIVLNSDAEEVVDDNPKVGSVRGLVSFGFANRLAYIQEQKLLEPTLKSRVINFTNNEVGSRCAYALTTVIAIVCRVADLIIGVIAAAAAIICFGQNKRINEVALKNLTIFGIINDISDGIRGIVNPRQIKFGYNPLEDNAKKRKVRPQFLTAAELRA